MKLSDLVLAIPGARAFGEADPEITGVAVDSREVRSGDLFVARRGQKDDGHTYVSAAIAKGAAAVAVEDSSAVAPEVSFLLVPQAAQALGLASAAVYGDPSSQLSLIGITGTNGKTTQTYLLQAILEKAGMATGRIGTVEYTFGGHRLDSRHTTPEPPLLHGTLRRWLDLGAQVVVMEISSHALALERICGLSVQVASFSNLTQDHLDFHGTMEAYFQAKARLFTEVLLNSKGSRPQSAIINIDDPWGTRLKEMCAVPVITYGASTEAMVSPLAVTMDLSGIYGLVLTPKGVIQVNSPLLGMHNFFNILAAIATACALDLPLDAIANGITDCQAIPGRLEPLTPAGLFPVLVDYAHTPDALTRVLECVRELARGRVILVFGCGGDRDRAKRPLMGQVAQKGADLVLVTSDNPRSEDPQAIIAQILEGMGQRGEAVLVEPDRRLAIVTALSLAGPDDIVLIAGKGHEKTQQVGARKLPFDDLVEARKALEGLTGKGMAGKGRIG